jgi:hypothetical protein
MKRLAALAGALVLGLGILVPSALAAAPMAHTGRVLISTQGDVTVAAGEQAVVVVQGHADIQGDVNTLVVVDGTATLTGAELETIVAVRGTIEVADGTVIYGELQRLDSTVHQSGNVQIQGGITDISGWFVEASAVLAPALFLLWIGFGLSTIVAALFLAALATRQVRAAEQLISRDPFVTFLVGLLSVIAIPVGAVLLLVTVVGAPLGFGVLFAVLPLLAYAGYLVAAIWLGEWLLGRRDGAVRAERPYAAATIGLLVAFVIGLVPIVTAVLSIFGLGAVVLAAWRTLRGAPTTRLASQPRPATA